MGGHKDTQGWLSHEPIFPFSEGEAGYNWCINSSGMWQSVSSQKNRQLIHNAAKTYKILIGESIKITI
jgi:hypothetical protein